MKYNLIIKSPFFLLTLILSSCATVPQESLNDNDLAINSSYLSKGDSSYNESDSNEYVEKPSVENYGLKKIPSIERNNVLFQRSKLAENFSESTLVNVTANDMLIKDFIHYVYGELLSTNYLLTPEVSLVKEKVTLNLKENVSKRRLYLLAESVLADRGLKLKYNENVYLISKIKENSKSGTTVGMGRELNTIPATNRKIMQVVPILFGIKTTLKSTIEQLADVSINIDVKQSALFITGDYNNVSRALELVQLLDSPANRGRHIGLVKLVYTSSDLYLQQLSILLENEGIPNSINTPDNKNLVFVPLPQIGSVAVFSATEVLFNRVKFWTAQIDKPSEGDVKQYFVFHPQFARAQDIGESLTPLISAKTASIKANISAKANSSDSIGNKSGLLINTSRNTGGTNEELTFVVDQRSNALIFYTTGTEYRNIIQLINRLDVLPKQVMLDIVVAEVTLSDDFEFGVKWAIQNGVFDEGGSGSGSNISFDGVGFGFLFDNGKGDSVSAAFSQADTNIKVLSNPSLLVRDGVTATLNIGTDIAIVGSTTEGLDDNDRITTTNQYRQTGINVSVTPTINAKGIVIMNIEESISNTLDGNGGGGNPNVFERNLSTEIVAESGQTIILGGLIDEQTKIVENKVPGLGDIPILGNLFRKETESVSRTELVLMVTPKVINRTDQWNTIISSFQNNLTNLKVAN
ncbi:MAG: secretin N-terminal domain-containing protein [Thalassotalea sp.]|nr:secretin N-terminal domain-containing protein [Thalassotalea sp.]